MGLFATFSIIDTQHNRTLCDAEYHYSECRDYFNAMPSVVMLSVVTPTVHSNEQNFTNLIWIVQKMKKNATLFWKQTKI
jgi:hypothetical protein